MHKASMVVILQRYNSHIIDVISNLNVWTPSLVIINKKIHLQFLFIHTKLSLVRALRCLSGRQHQLKYEHSTSYSEFRQCEKYASFGTGDSSYPFPEPETVVKAVLEAIELGYRMFDTASGYHTEEALGEAIYQAISLGQSSSPLSSGAPIIMAIASSLLFKQLCISMKPGAPFPVNVADVVPMDIRSVWTAMEDCQTLGLTKSIGVSNFSCKKLADILAFAKIPPAINQVEMNPTWQQGKLREFCQANGIMIAAFSPLGGPGAFWGSSGVLESEVLMEIAKSKGKSVAQVALRWVYEQGVVIVLKSFNKQRLKHNLEIFDWGLSDEESKKIAKIPQSRAYPAEMFISETGPIKSVEELWDGEL